VPKKSAETGGNPRMWQYCWIQISLGEAAPVTITKLLLVLNCESNLGDENSSP
jgi:hypothetical protein